MDKNNQKKKLAGSALGLQLAANAGVCLLAGRRGGARCVGRWVIGDGAGVVALGDGDAQRGVGVVVLSVFTVRRRLEVVRCEHRRELLIQ